MELNSGFDAKTQGWTPPPGLAGSGPRDVQLTVAGWIVFVMGLAMIGGSLPAGVALWREVTRQTERDRRIQEAGVEADATITRLWRTSGKDSTHRVAYELRHEGSIYRSNVRVPRNIWNRLHEGEPLRVRFVPSDPSLSQPVDWTQKPMWKGIPLTVSGALVGFGGMMFWLVQRAKSLLSEGRAIPGIVTRHMRTKDGVILKYEFRSPDGGLRKGSSGAPRRGNISPVGSTITVIYDPDNPKRNGAYPCKLVKLQRD